jgi:hypothetical protein
MMYSSVPWNLSVLHLKLYQQSIGISVRLANWLTIKFIRITIVWQVNGEQEGLFWHCRVRTAEINEKATAFSTLIIGHHKWIGKHN